MAASIIIWVAVLVAAVILPNLGGWAGALIVVKNLSWYESLKRPSWAPPTWAFGPIWTVLYSSIGLASFLVLTTGLDTGTATIPLIIYAINLLLNWLWTPIFFGAHALKLAFLEILLVTLTGILTAVVFYNVNTLAGLILVPYVIWLAIATALAYDIHQENAPDEASSLKET